MDRHIQLVGKILVALSESNGFSSNLYSSFQARFDFVARVAVRVGPILLIDGMEMVALKCSGNCGGDLLTHSLSFFWLSPDF